MSLARPAAVLRRPLQNDLKKHIAIATVGAAVSALAWKFLVSDWRKKKYQEFHSSYNEERHLQRMIQAGVFDSVKPEGSPTPQWVTDYEKEVDEAIAALKK